MCAATQSFVDDYLQPLIPVHRFITVAALITGAAQLHFSLQPDSQPVPGQAGAG